MNINHPISEQTIKKHKYQYKNLKYINDLGHPCEYRIVDSLGNDLEVAKYYRGRFLCSYGYSNINQPKERTK